MNLVNFIATFPAIFFSDSFGRRILLIAGAIVCTLSCFLLGFVGSGPNPVQASQRHGST